MEYRRDISLTLEERLGEPRAFIQIVLGPRQTGKTTAVRQALKSAGIPSHVAVADSAEDVGPAWLEVEWMQARSLAARGPAVLFVDEVQKVRGWSQTVKRLWDEDSWDGTDLKVVLSGSSSLLLGTGVSESLMGRHEMIRSTHWDLSEMSAAFGYTLEDYLVFGGYPGAARLKASPRRWRDYMRDSIIEATISKDILQMERVRKPALMRALFELGAQCSAQEISYRKILGQLDDKGNTETVRNYLDLLAGAGMMSGLQKFDPKQVKSRASSPRLLVHDPSLMTSSWRSASSLTADPSQRGHLVETAVGASLLAWGQREGFEVYWWRDGGDEVDYVVQRGEEVAAIEVKSGRVKPTGIVGFCQRYPQARPLVVG
ncbi:MAG: ATP-binding protein, partial [Coriobacteriales bacterium]